MLRKLGIASLSTLIVLLVGMAFFAILRPVRVLPRMALAPGYVLVDQAGERLTNEDLRGKIVLYTFTFTGCGEGCPPLDAVMHGVRERVPEVDTDGVPVRLVTIALDAGPLETEDLRRAAARSGADGEVWRFATAEPALLKQTVGGGFGVYYEQLPDGAFRFDPVFVLVDGWGITRAQHRVGIPDAGALATQIQLLGNEVRASKGMARYAYEAAHLFACYP